MNLSNKSQALEDAAKEILEGYGYGATRGSNWKAVRNGSANLDTMIDTAKTTKSKNNFYIFNNKGQIYHTAPTLEKARKHAAEFNRSTSKEIGYPTILDLSKGKIVESADIKESSKAKTIKVGEDAVGSASTQYVLVKDRTIVAIGEKAELLQKSKAEGGRVWIVGEHKCVGDLLESTNEAKSTKLREKTDLKAWDDGGTHANSMMKLKEFIGPEELDSKFGTRKCLEIEKISEGRVSKHTTTTYLSLNANDIKVIKEFLDTYETDEDKPNV